MPINFIARRILTPFVLWALMPIVASASTRWAETLGGTAGDNLTSVQSTSDGGYLLAGSTSSFGAGPGDAWCSKVDSAGSVVWQKTYGGTSWDAADAIRSLPGGGLILVGYAMTAANVEIMCMKLDSLGNILWERTYAGALPMGAVDIQVTADGGYVLVAAVEGPEDAYCLRLDAAGNKLWSKTYGGASDDTARAVRTTSDGGYVLAGRTKSFGAGSDDGWCVKIDGSGNIVWEKAYGGLKTDMFTNILPAPDGGWILVGRTSSYGAGLNDGWCVKIDESGNVAWQRTYGGSADDYFYDIQPTAEHGCLLAGWTKSFGAGSADAWCLKLDGDGNVIWEKTYGGSAQDTVGSALATSDGGYLLVGTTSTFGAGSSDGWHLKIDANGEIDPSCATLVQTSTASVATSTATVSPSSATTSDLSLATSVWSGVAAGSAAVSTVQCSGTSGPVITVIKSKTSKPGSTATIRGTGFSTDKTKNIVYFGTRKVKAISSAKPTSLKLTIPKKAKGMVNVYVVVNGEKSNLLPFTVK